MPLPVDEERRISLMDVYFVVEPTATYLFDPDETCLILKFTSPLFFVGGGGGGGYESPGQYT